MKMWTRIKIWWVSGGDMFCGYDDCGEKMYTVNNGTALLMWVCSLVGLALACLIAVGLVRLVVWL